ncbi:inositol monophosphatase family protein [Rhodopirellula sallentina]|uniref:Inositol monophosphatase family protein n=1 Tax=Rhodopirellula sallentina SM41 TaxID=1263870 RepID=M5U5L8_9BACT|nr:inositol monophosphatase family protein [Rhodopirellula sallentina]EMI56742.1 inositol monophosphatase family protein [Rhodopirellula sallentina SM41]
MQSQELFDQWRAPHAGRLTAMIEVGLAAGAKTLEHFQNRSLEVIRKGDDSPVTIADREAELRTRELLAEMFPGDTIAGEEFAEQTGDNEYRWTVDPIDGTKSFICGVPLYSTLLAIEHAGQPLGGMILIPALGQAVVGAIGHGAFYAAGLPSTASKLDSDTSIDWTPAKVSKRDKLSDAIFVTSEVGSFGKRGNANAYQRLEEACFLSRTWGDGYGYLMVATGRADVMVDPICNAWDVAAMLPILTEAGGRFTDWTGTPTVRGGDGVGTNAVLHDQVIDLLR